MRSVLWVTAAAAVLAAGGNAAAQQAGEHGPFGVGADAFLGTSALSIGTAQTGTAAMFEFDSGKFLVDALVSFLWVDSDTRGGSDFTVVTAGGRFYWILHRARSADFSAGGGVALGAVDPDPGSTDLLAVLEGGAKIRAFIVPNVALSITAGLGVVITDDTSVLALGSRLTGSAGFTYFF